MKITSVFAAVGLLVGAVEGQQAGYQQCGGLNWTGGKTCIEGWHCERLNEHYSQCLPGAGTTTASNTGTVIPTSTPSSTSSSTGPQPTAPGTGPGSMLQPNYLWIRGVTAPNFHKYLQSSTARTATDAVLEANTSAGQFNVVSGQLVQLIDTVGSLLYGHVQNFDDSSLKKLKLTWGAAPSSYGTFGFQGDTLTWTHASINRQNNAAFLVCENQRVYVNLGAFGYQTPAGCSDHTIHYYNGATADP